MDSNEIIAMFDECTLPLSKARSLLRMLAVAINSRDPIHQEHLISGIEVIEELMEEGLKGLMLAFISGVMPRRRQPPRHPVQFPRPTRKKTMFSLANSEAINKAATMSSREVADLTGKQHKHVLDDCRKMFDSLKIQSADFSADYQDERGRTYQEFC